MKFWLKDNRSFILFLCFFGFFRLAVADWNPIPSGSMRPTLLEGDVVVAELGEPQRGDFCFAQRRRALDQLLGPTLKDFIQGQT